MTPRVPLEGHDRDEGHDLGDGAGDRGHRDGRAHGDDDAARSTEPTRSDSVCDHREMEDPVASAASDASDASTVAPAAGWPGLPVGVIARTPRLIVRAFRPDDWADLLAYLSLPAVYRFEPGEPIDAPAARFLAAERAQADDFFALELTETGRVIGHCSFLRDGPAELATRSLGFIVHPDLQGRGLAAEGGRAVVEHGFRDLALHRVRSECHPDNIASWRTLERIGFVREGHLRSNIFFRRDAAGRPLWQDTFLYALVAPTA
jgi:ribosomal-protein-alanine N-acetyltransferase